MINNQLCVSSESRGKKSFRFIGIVAALLLFMGTGNVFAEDSYAQNKLLTLELVNTTMRDVFNEIEKSSEYIFFYSDEVNVYKKVAVNAKDKAIDEIMSQVLKGTDYTYTVSDRQVFIKTKEEAPAAAVSEVRSVEQARVATGVVVDRLGDPVIGANVVVKGQTTIGTITDIDGKFSIDAPEGAVLVISYIGYTTQEVTVRGTAPLNIVMEDDSEMMEEVVVVGYGIQKKVNLSGSVATVDSKQLENRPIQNLTNGLQGLMPGVTITGTNGAPGMDNGNIRVRGIGTLNNADPYILVDGIQTGTLNSVDPNDIESISVLKDAASAAIYGSKAANGVILITTKRGKKGKAQVSYSGYVSFQNATKLIDRMGSYEYATLLNQALDAEGTERRFTDEELAKFKAGNDPLYPDTDWYDLAYKTGVQHRHNVNINGGAENVNYMASLGYMNQTGILPNAAREQFNARANLDMKLTDRLSARLNMSYIKNEYDDPSSAYYGGNSDQIIRQLNLIAPWIVARYDDGTWGTISDGSPIAWLDSGMKVTRDNYNFSGVAALDYKIIDGLMLTLQGAYVNNVQNYSYFRKYICYNDSKESEPTQLDERYYTWNRTNYDVLLNYDKAFGNHNIKGLAGWHTEKYNYRYLRGVRQNFPNNESTDMDAGDAATQTNAGNTAELAMLSWFGRINYDYAGKYLFEANIRADASSRFAEGHRWGYFPSFSAAWRVTEEDFMLGLREDWLTNLKIRGSWGQLGNQDALTGTENDYYPAMNVYNLDGKYVFNGVMNSGFYQKKYRLSTITWEKVTSWGFGVDFTLFNKLTGSIDYYNRKTNGIIQDVTVPNEFALDAYKDNIGSMRNQGIELILSYATRIGEVDLGLSGNFSYNNNKILDLGQGDPDKYLDVTNGYNQRNKVGEAMNSYYIYRANGFFNSQEEADAFTEKYGNPFSKKFKAGDLRYVDTNGDGKLDANDREYAGSPDPKYTFGFNINAGWKNFDIALMFNGAAGVKRMFDAHEVHGNFSGDAAHPATIWRDAWTENNHNASMPRIFYATESPSSPRIAASDFWLQDITYLRLKNLQVGYTFPKSLLNTLGVGNVRLFYSVENLLTFDKMDINIDPESTSQRMSSYPLLRTHAFGINVSF